LIIPLDVKDYGGGPKPFARAFLRIPKYRVWGIIQPFVDTGSPVTILSQVDAERLQIPFNAIAATHRPKIHYIGGISFSGYPIENFKLTMRDENNNRQEFVLESVDVLKLTKRDQDSLYRMRAIPSILGMDFLIKFGFVLNFDPAKRTAFLRKD